MKNKAARAMEEVIRLKQGGVDTDTYSDTKSEAKLETTTEAENSDSITELKKKLKKQDERIVKLRNESQKYKQDYDKAMKVIEREVGEGQTVEEILKSESSWKGRAQKIEMLKAKIKQLKFDPWESVSGQTFQSEISIPKSHAEKNLETLGTNRARELDKIKEELIEARDQLDTMTQKYKGASSRKTAIENEMKELKSLMASKVKVLLDKSENDDKLINLLREENKRLKSGKGQKASTKTTDSKQSEEDQETIYNLKNDNAKLKSDIIVLKADASKKEAKINELLKNCIGAPDEILEEKEAIINDLEEQVDKLMRENFLLKNNKTDQFTRKSQTESEQIIKDLSQQNAKLRMKVADLTEKIKDTA